MQINHGGPLMLLMGGFLNQDWPFAYPTIWAAVDEFILEESPVDVQDAARELRDVFLSQTWTERQLDEMLTTYSCAYVPSEQGTTYREWLVELEQRLSRA